MNHAKLQSAHRTQDSCHNTASFLTQASEQTDVCQFVIARDLQKPLPHLLACCPQATEVISTEDLTWAYRAESTFFVR